MSESDDGDDWSALRAHVGSRLDVDVTDVEVLADGLNLTLAVSTGECRSTAGSRPDAEGASEIADQQQAVDQPRTADQPPTADQPGPATPTYVVRRPNELRGTDLFLDLRAEYAVLEALEGTSIPAPEPVLYCEDESVLDGAFLVATFLPGSVVPLGDRLPERFRTPRARRRLAEELVDVLAAIHSLDAAPFEATCDRMTAREQVVRAGERLDAVERATGEAFPVLRSVEEWLLDAAPRAPARALVHGDYRPGNVLFDGATEPTVAGVIDWETAMLGDPLTELGYLLLRWRDEGDPTPSLSDVATSAGLEEVPASLERANEHGLAPFTAEPGSPTRRELVERYEAATGTTFEHERFYRAHAAFLLATVWADLHREAVAAGEASEHLPYVRYAAAIAERVVDGEFPL